VKITIEIANSIPVTIATARIRDRDVIEMSWGNPPSLETFYFTVDESEKIEDAMRNARTEILG
jgi:hypothetical protein